MDNEDEDLPPQNVRDWAILAMDREEEMKESSLTWLEIFSKRL